MLGNIGVLLFFLGGILAKPELVLARPGWTLGDQDPSVVRIGELGAGACTGTRVSQEGHILTARHCFHGCLIGGKQVNSERLFPEAGHMSPELFTLEGSAFCSALVDGIERRIEILMVGPGFMIPMQAGSLSQMDRPLYLELLEQQMFHNGDYALIQILDEPRSAKDCRPIDTRGILPGESVFARGFPIRSTGRPEGRNSSGDSLARAEGSLRQSILENSCVQADARYNTAQLVQAYDRRDLLLSTLDSLPGMSGAALRSADDRIVGVINSQFRHRIDVESTYCDGGTVAVPIGLIHQRALDVLGTRRTQEAFACPDEELFAGAQVKL